MGAAPMITLTHSDPIVNPAPADDAGPYVPPSEDDRRWAAENLNDDWPDADGPEPNWDDLAGESADVERL
jgi:hypothetical protein